MTGRIFCSLKIEAHEIYKNLLSRIFCSKITSRIHQTSINSFCLSNTGREKTLSHRYNRVLCILGGELYNRKLRICRSSFQ